MGRTRTKKKGHPKPGDTPAKAAPPSTESLLEKAQSLIIQCDYELAVRFIHRALEQDPKNAEAKEMLGISLLEMGDLEAAKEVRLTTEVS